MWQDLSWKSLLYGGPGKDLKILPASTLDVLPSPTNLRCWGNTVVDPYCSLCHAWACTTRHVLGACRVALDQRRCTWRQDNVLWVIVRNMREEIRFSAAANTVQTENSNELDFISFCKAGEKPVRVQPRQIWFPPDLLSAASDWKYLVDSVSAKISFRSCVARTTLRPDIVLYSTSRRIVFWMELTVCAEDRFSVSTWNSFCPSSQSIKSDCSVDNPAQSLSHQIQVPSMTRSWTRWQASLTSSSHLENFCK